MPNYVMLNQPNKMEWLERPAAQAGNFLYQMALANHAARLRSEEAVRERQAEEERYNKRMDTTLGISGFQLIPENEAVPIGAIKIGKRYYKPPEIKTTPLTYEGKFLGYVVSRGDKMEFMKAEKEDKTNQPSSVKEWEFEKAQFEAGQGPDPGPYGPWNIKQNASKAIRIGLDEKIETQEAMKDIDRRSFIQTAAWDKQVADVAKSKFDLNTWNKDMPSWQREKEIFATADNDIKTVYKEFNPYFGVKDGVQGWYGKNPKNGKFELIKRWGSKPQIEQPSNIPVPPNPMEPGVVRKKF